MPFAGSWKPIPPLGKFGSALTRVERAQSSSPGGT